MRKFVLLMVACMFAACDSSEKTSSSPTADMAVDSDIQPDGSVALDEGVSMADAGGTPDEGLPLADASVEPDPIMPELEVLATGANISSANGLHFGPDGMLYVASVLGNEIVVIDPESGEITRRIGADDGMSPGPDDVAFGPDGSYFWTSLLTGEVAGFNAEGERVVAAQLSPGVNPITFSDDGRLFIAQCFLATGVYELDPTGEEAPRLITNDLGPGCGLNGMDWGPDNRLYGPRWFAGEVVSLDVETGVSRVEATGFTVPAAVKFDSQGVLHVIDNATGELVRVVDGTNEVVATVTSDSIISHLTPTIEFLSRARLMVS